MQTRTVEKMSGHVEVDETYIGGKAHNMHVAKRDATMGKEPSRRKGMVGKVAVMGLLERHTGRFEYRMIDNNKLTTLDMTVRQAVASGSNLYSDALGSYRKLNDEYIDK